MVPDSERHGTPKSQFTLWFGVNMQITAVVNGALAIVFGADVVWAIVGLFIGQIVGGAVMALHSAQGPALGLPQMISSRAQFGVYGAALPLFLVLLLYFGFAATGTVLAGQAINNAFGVQPRWIGILVFAALTAIIAMFGYDLIHKLGKVSSTVGLLGLLYIAVRLFQVSSFGSQLTDVHFSAVPFLLSIALAAGWQLTYAPYASDYSRYLPRDTKFGRAWFGPFAGSVLGATISMTLGVFIAAAGGQAFIGDQVGFMGNLAQNRVLAILIFISIVIGKLTINALNAYGGVMALSTALSGFTGRSSISPKTRFGFVIGFNVVVVLTALAASSDFLQVFKSFILTLLMFFLPWSAINLINYYLICRRRIDIPALYTSRGRYGKLHWPTIVVYLLGVAVQIPFISQAFYVGPMATAMGGADISWLVGLVVTALVYYPLGRRAFDYPLEMVYSKGVELD
ncbi:cytosine permease [Cutibacterium namnetense]|uniref:Cytosine permease n=2 Tax=Cutibacterium namnetense TaxID=1574624 RepID=A0ABX9I7Z6_9ACTN|nr:cytosine permease [Cutibacterium namnetense]